MEKLITLNDWRFRSLVIFLAPLQLLVIILAIVPASFVPGSFLRQLVGLVYLTFIPGFLLMRILRIHNISGTKTVLYSVGLSISLVIFAGMTANFLLPPLGMSRPISSLPIVLSVSVLVVGLGVIAYVRDHGFTAAPLPVPVTHLATPSFLLLIMLPLIGAIAALLSIRLGNNVLSLTTIALIAFVVIIIAMDKFVLPSEYAFAIFAINYAIFLYHGILTGPYSLGFNLDDEYYSQTLLLNTGHWSALTHALFSSLGSTLLGPIYSLVTGADIAQVRSGVYPFIFSLLVLVVFSVCREQGMGPKKAFFAAFFMVAIVTLWQINLHATRYLVGTLFFGLLVVLVVDRQLLVPQKTTLAITAALSLAVSYYGTATISAVLFFGAWGVFSLMRSRTGRKHWQDDEFVVKNPSLLRFTWVALCLVLALSWQMYTSPGLHFTQPFLILQHAYKGLADFFSPEVRPSDVAVGLGAGLGGVSVPVRVSRVLHYVTQALIVIGVLRSLFYPRSLSFRTDYIALAFSASVLLGASVLVPYLAFSWGTSRIYFFSLIVLAPFVTVGGETAWRGAIAILRRAGRKRKAVGAPHSALSSSESGSGYLRVLALLILVPIMLFQSGFVYETLYKVLPEYAQQQGLIRSWHLVPDKMDQFAFSRSEAKAMEWLYVSSGYRMKVVVDKFGMMLATFWFGNVSNEIIQILPDMEIPPGTYIYFRGWNNRQEQVRFDEIRTAFFTYTLIKDLPLLNDAVNSADRIYDSGEARIFLRR